MNRVRAGERYETRARAPHPLLLASDAQRCIGRSKLTDVANAPVAAPTPLEGKLHTYARGRRAHSLACSYGRRRRRTGERERRRVSEREQADGRTLRAVGRAHQRFARGCSLARSLARARARAHLRLMSLPSPPHDKPLPPPPPPSPPSLARSCRRLPSSAVSSGRTRDSESTSTRRGEQPAARVVCRFSAATAAADLRILSFVHVANKRIADEKRSYA